MSVSFTLLKANGQRFDPLPGHDDREFSLSNANAADVLDALGIEDSFSERPWPIPCFRALLIVARRKRLGHASPAIPVTETRKPGTMLVIDCGRAEGYIEQKLAKLSDLVNEGVEIGATACGMGLTPDHPPDDGDASDVGRPPSGSRYTRGLAAREARGRSSPVSSNCTSRIDVKLLFQTGAADVASGRASGRRPARTWSAWFHPIQAAKMAPAEYCQVRIVIIRSRRQRRRQSASFAHVLDCDGMRRARLRRRENIHKRYLIHVAAPEPSDPGPDRLRHARRLVAVGCREVAAPGAVDIGNVAVADGAGGRPDQDLARGSIDSGASKARQTAALVCMGPPKDSSTPSEAGFRAPRRKFKRSLMRGACLFEGADGGAAAASHGAFDVQDAV